VALGLVCPVLHELRGDGVCRDGALVKGASRPVNNGAQARGASRPGSEFVDGASRLADRIG